MNGSPNEKSTQARTSKGSSVRGRKAVNDPPLSPGWQIVSLRSFALCNRDSKDAIEIRWVSLSAQTPRQGPSASSFRS